MSRKTDLVVSSTVRGAAKKAIEINLLTHRDCTTTEAAAMRQCMSCQTWLLSVGME